ncbi:MAG TPA: cation-translocating P-type ATPase, partial [Pseudonocardiaceae bacterium]|nr:cation-translocating P-type ATPase [Pseudonocardiaceae bacterium]
MTAPAQVLRGTSVVVGRAVDVAGEVATVGVGVAAMGAQVAVGAARSVPGVVRRVVAVGTRHWQEGQRFHIPLRAPHTGTGGGPQQAIKKVVAGVLEHPDVLVAYWDGGLGRLVVQVAEDAVTDRVVEVATAVATKYGLISKMEEAEEVAHPGSVGEIRTAALALALDAAGLAGAWTAGMVRLRCPPQTVTAALTLVREDPRLRSVLRSRWGKTTAEVVLAAANAAVSGVGQSPIELLLDAALRAGQLAEAVARVAAFDAAHDQLCVPERTSVGATAPIRRPAPVDPLHDYAVKATTGSVIGAAVTLLFRRNLEEASAAVLAGSPKPARYGWAAYQAGLGCVLAREGVLVRDSERLRLLQVLDTMVVHSSALAGTGRTVVEANPNVAEWSQDRLWQAAERALCTTEPSDTDLRLRPVLDNPETTTGLMIASAQGQDVGTVLVGHQPDPLAQAAVDAARQAGLRVVVLDGSGVGDQAGLADEIVGPGRCMSEVVSALQDDGHVVLTIARLGTGNQEVGGLLTLTDPDVVAGLLRGDLAVTLADEGSAVVWAADLVCARDLTGVWRLLLAVPAARQAGQHAMMYAQAAAALSGLLVITGEQRRWARLLSPLARVSPVNMAAAAALMSGWRLALGVATTAAPNPRPQLPWHALTPDEVLLRLTKDSRRTPDARPGLAEQGHRLIRAVSRLPGAGPMRLSLQLADAVRIELNDPLTPILAVGAAAS